MRAQKMKVYGQRFMKILLLIEYLPLTSVSGKILKNFPTFMILAMACEHIIQNFIYNSISLFSFLKNLCIFADAYKFKEYTFNHMNIPR